jgi:hypothetical protein
MSAKTFFLFIVVLMGVSAGVFQLSYSTGLDEGFEQGYMQGNDVGLTTGLHEGYEDGFDQGFDEGTEDGLEQGYNEGFDVGNSTGFDLGFDDSYDEGYHEGSETGYGLGFDEGYGNGSTLGFEGGYIAGYNVGNETGYDIGYVEGLVDSSNVGFVLRDPTYEEAIRFIREDATDEFEYVTGEFECRHFAAIFIENAFNQGLRCLYVQLAFPEGGHAIVAFNTIDLGMIYIEPQNDDIVTPVVGNVYCDRGKYLPPTYDDTVLEILLIF